MPNLPEELVLDILKRIGRHDYRDLGPFIAASKETMNLVFSREVLSSVDLSNFLCQSSMVNKDSRFRKFFISCVEHGNVMANQLEGLRILCQEGPTEAAFSMLQLSPAHSIYAPFVVGIFKICAGQFETGMRTLLQMWDNVDAWEEAVHIADMVIMQIVDMGPARSGLYFSSYSYPVDDIPHCTYISCTADNVCEECFAFWYSLIIRSIC